MTIQAQILHLMKQLAKEKNTAILLITHDLGVVAEMADHVAVMYAGQVVEYTDVFSLFSSPKHPYTQGLLDSTPKFHESEEELVSIKGTVPTPSSMPAGCKFNPRCPHAMDICRMKEPALDTIEDNRQVRCWLYGEEATLA